MPSLVQSAIVMPVAGGANPYPSVVLPSAPTPGNLLIAFWVNAAGGFDLNPAWTNISYSTTNPDNWIISYRVVQSGDSANTPPMNIDYSGNYGSCPAGVFEIAGGNNSGPAGFAFQITSAFNGNAPYTDLIQGMIAEGLTPVDTSYSNELIIQAMWESVTPLDFNVTSPWTLGPSGTNTPGLNSFALASTTVATAGSLVDCVYLFPGSASYRYVAMLGVANAPPSTVLVTPVTAVHLPCVPCLSFDVRVQGSGGWTLGE